MSGHSKWSTIKRKKGVNDARRGAIFTKMAREIQVAARDGADPEFNFRLRLIVDKAKAANMPKDNIARAIRRGAGLEKGAELEEITYEGYGPGGVALFLEVLTDNRNRAIAEIRYVLNRGNGTLGEGGSVSWQFESRGYIALPMGGHEQDDVFMVALEAGADDVEFSDSIAEVYTEPADLKRVQDAFEAEGFEVDTAELTKTPKTPLSLDEKTTRAAMALIESLEDLEDVTNVYSNLDISDEILADLAV
ncbi:MAG: YebC/PmpR family DNA-binding transcriptional regulator [Chloroflexota bacterium]|nr:YebC/PmpR family DNA-binding transcriptional regulator [Chloroflexota bacterium]